MENLQLEKGENAGQKKQQAGAELCQAQLSLKLPGQCLANSVQFSSKIVNKLTLTADTGYSGLRLG